MGRKRKKRQWRKSESTEQINAALHEASKVSTVKATKDDELFFVDDKVSRVKPVAKPKVARKQKPKKRKRPASFGNRQKNKAIKSTDTQESKQEELFDLWAEAPTKVEKRNAKRSKDENTAVVPAVEFSAGSSYKPDEEQRKRAVASAAAEVMVQEARIAATKAMLEEDKERLIAANAQSSEDEDDGGAYESSEGEDSGSDGDGTNLPEGIYKLPRSKRSKLTVAQRNKLKRGRKEHGRLVQQNKERKMAEQLNSIKSIKKAMAHEEAERTSANDRLKKLIQQTKADPSSVVAKRGGKPYVMVSEPAVIIEDEKGGSMRRMPVKGSIVRDRMHSMLRRNKFQMGKKGAKQSQRKGRKKAVGPERWGVQALVASQQRGRKLRGSK